MLTIFTLDLCPNCEELKKILSDRDIKFEELSGETLSPDYLNWRQDYSVIDYMATACFCNVDINEMPIILDNDRMYSFEQYKEILNA